MCVGTQNSHKEANKLIQTIQIIIGIAKVHSKTKKHKIKQYESSLQGWRSKLHSLAALLCIELPCTVHKYILASLALHCNLCIALYSVQCPHPWQPCTARTADKGTTCDASPPHRDVVMSDVMII